MSEASEYTVKVHGYFDMDLFYRVNEAFDAVKFRITSTVMNFKDDSMDLEFKCYDEDFDHSPDFFYAIEEIIGKKFKVTNDGNMRYLVSICRD